MGGKGRLSVCGDCIGLAIGNCYLRGFAGRYVREHIGRFSVFRINKSFGLCVTIRTGLMPPTYKRGISWTQCAGQS